MKKFKRGGMVGDIINGTGGLIVLTVLVFVIVSTLLAANLLGADSTSAETTTDETGAWINSTTYYLGGGTINTSRSNYAITGIINTTGAYVIGAGNYTLDTATGAIVNATAATWDPVTINYTFTYSFDNRYKVSTDAMGANLTSGVNNVSTKIPTILLIAAVVLLFGVIVLLIKQAGAMGIGSKGASL